VLEQSSQRWHQGKHDSWPTMNVCCLFSRRRARNLNSELARSNPRAAQKPSLVEHAVETIAGEFGLADLERLCPGVSRDMIRLLLRDLKAAGRVECLGRGPGAKWRKSVLPVKEGNKEGNN
jgi:hypothetical protein